MLLKDWNVAQVCVLVTHKLVYGLYVLVVVLTMASVAWRSRNNWQCNPKNWTVFVSTRSNRTLNNPSLNGEVAWRNRRLLESSFLLVKLIYTCLLLYWRCSAISAYILYNPAIMFKRYEFISAFLPFCIWINYLVALGMCNGSCKLYILSLFHCICTEHLLRIVSSNYFFPILWECCAIKMPMLRISASLEMFYVTESKGIEQGKKILEKLNVGCVSLKLSSQNWKPEIQEL